MKNLTAPASLFTLQDDTQAFSVLTATFNLELLLKRVKKQCDFSFDKLKKRMIPIPKNSMESKKTKLFLITIFLCRYTLTISLTRSKKTNYGTT